MHVHLVLLMVMERATKVNWTESCRAGVARSALENRPGVNSTVRRGGRRLFLRQFVFKFTCELGYVGSFAKGLDFLLGGIHIHARMLAEFLQHLQYGRQFLLGKHADLKVEMGAPFGLAGHSILTDEHEDCQEHAFGRNDDGQDAKGKRIKCLEPPDRMEIEQAPDGDQPQLSQDES